MRRLIKLGAIAALTLAGSLAPAASQAGTKPDSGVYLLIPASEPAGDTYALTQRGFNNGDDIQEAQTATQWGFVTPSQGGTVRPGYPFTVSSLDSRYNGDSVYYLMKNGTHNCLWYQSSESLASYNPCEYSGDFLWVQHGEYYVNVGASDAPGAGGPQLLCAESLQSESAVVVVTQGSVGCYVSWTN
jgi:hypothetical protein